MSNLIFALITILFLGVTETPGLHADRDSESLQKKHLCDSKGKTQRLNDAKTQSKDSVSLCLCDSEVSVGDCLVKKLTMETD